MNVLIFGASGMLGPGVLRECRRADDVSQVTCIVCSPPGLSHPRLREIVHDDFFGCGRVENQLANVDACFFCLGVSSFRTEQAQYQRLTLDLTRAAARTLARLNPVLHAVYVSGVGSDSSERGRRFRARIKGRTENQLQQLPFRAAYAFRLGLIQPLGGIASKTALSRIGYVVLGPRLPLRRRFWPDQMLTSASLGQAMLAVVRHGSAKRVPEPADINALAR
ncbi:hypothetical protein DFR29_11027 [Tahibacter aquaticus]|uniref:Epimerase n=1 Tax=Tahibacter aquaticus TaxID=520092 RepID=A0A4R6YTJ6_9GAMM|nr:epimerase [Tahibacter aquaticus]TDR41545.1 hypothetical protein DFR29_11027 [Tahibacter aquaticus]